MNAINDITASRTVNISKDLAVRSVGLLEFMLDTNICIFTIRGRGEAPMAGERDE
ncbi:MAG: hypothetical protein WED00_16305 [Aquisalimonadaceae bacterium]